MRRAKVRSLFVVLASLSVAVAGCGVTAGEGASQVSSGLAPVRASAASLSAAAQQTKAVTTQRIHIEITTSETAVGAISMSVDGEIDAANKRIRLTTAYDGSSSVLGNLNMETVTDGKVIYIKSELFSKLTNGKPWVKVSAGDADAIAAFDRGLQSGPTAALDFFEDTGSQVKTLGTEYVRGVETRHVRTTIDLAKAVDEATGSRKQKLRSQIEGLGASLDSLEPISMDAWLDGDGYVRKLMMTIRLSSAADEGSQEVVPAVTQTIELFDFNEPVDIQMPNPDDVSEIDPSLLAGD